jgi:hypothetical protein
MLLFVSGVIAGTLVAVVVAAPLWLPWPATVRWSVSAQLPGLLDSWAGVPNPSLAFREVVLVDVAVTDGRVDLIGQEVISGHATTSEFQLAGDVPSAGVIAAVEGWCTAATPLLMWAEPAVRVHLYGPNQSVTELRLVDRIQS